MNMDTLTQCIVAVAGVLIPIICAYCARLVKKYIPTKSLLTALEQFAKDAVVLAEKAGLNDKLLNKKQYAINKLQDMLENVGFNQQDVSLLSDCIERAYCELKNDIESVYQKKIYSLSETTDKDGNIKPELKGSVANEEK
ncbi:MAG TPA: phage holin family protein [Candidatus Ligilactobacillus excrementigallinarum]|uniref:Phage holin family protein n=1 Tax=Candidatus Ligilactobacillus excrementigallinarum TaxID=2838641 RepID=A0A9D1UVJ5_9LACO|nr:phage holin family protein [Candidatus Ligilactobacillus excrementigallinarum]